MTETFLGDDEANRFLDRDRCAPWTLQAERECRVERVVYRPIKEPPPRLGQNTQERILDDRFETLFTRDR